MAILYTSSLYLLYLHEGHFELSDATSSRYFLSSSVMNSLCSMPIILRKSLSLIPAAGCTVCSVWYSCSDSTYMV